jgi:sialate O-acetylesterase
MNWISLVVVHLQLASIFTDNMVLQRGQPIHLWGKAAPGQQVRVQMGRQHFVNSSTVTSADSTWSIYLPAQKADSIGRDLLVVSEGGDSLRLRNILIGDLWLCIGQSNMEFPLGSEMHFEKEKTDASQSLIRLYNPSYIGKNAYGKPFTDSMLQRLTPAAFYQGAWVRCDSVTAKTMSAVGYYFGKTIARQKQIPIGLIHLAIGGCPIETFMSRDALSRFPGKLDSPWLDNNKLPVWVRERGRQNGVVDAHGYKPAFAFAAGIEPLLPLPIKGIIWYQGESNAQELERAEEYPRLQEAMIADLRQKWRQPDLPFYWVQLSSIDTAHYKSRYWPEFRDGQRKMLDEIKNGGMAVSSDLGARDDVHPTDKRTVGLRLARWALHDVYGKNNLVVSGPLPARVSWQQDSLLIYFKYGKGLRTSDGRTLRGFLLDGVAVEGFVQADHVVLPTTKKPTAVYYGWEPYSDANLVNGEGLPASTFKLTIP